MNVRVEYEPTPIRHLAVQCPKCNNWFNGWAVMKGAAFHNLRYKHDIASAKFHCPICNEDFGYKFDQINYLHIKEVNSAEECYKDCLTKKETWE